MGTKTFEYCLDFKRILPFSVGCKTQNSFTGLQRISNLKADTHLLTIAVCRYGSYVRIVSIGLKSKRLFIVPRFPLTLPEN